MEKKKLNKTTKSNLITYGMVLAAYLIVQGMIAGNLLSNLMQGLLVPLCVYIILALSLNLTVGILGELSLGHAGFMCIGAFTSAAFTKAFSMMIDSMASSAKPSETLRLLYACRVKPNSPHRLIFINCTIPT